METTNRTSRLPFIDNAIGVILLTLGIGLFALPFIFPHSIGNSAYGFPILIIAGFFSFVGGLIIMIMALLLGRKKSAPLTTPSVDARKDGAVDGEVGEEKK